MRRKAKRVDGFIALRFTLYERILTFHVYKRIKTVTIESIMGIGQEAIKTILLVAGPMLGLSLVVGLMVSAFQAMTQINEMTLTFLPKIVTMFVVLLFMFPWMVEIIVGFMTGIWLKIPEMAQ